jgi:hypothetical protein
MPAPPLPPSSEHRSDGAQARVAPSASGGAVVVSDAGPAELAAQARPSGGLAAWLPGLAVVSIVTSAMLMMIISSLGPSAGEPPLPFVRSGGLPFFTRDHPGPRLVSYGLWFAVVVGAVGVAAGLLAVRRGWRPRPRLLITGSLIGVILLMVLPPIGSADMVDDAIHGRIAALGYDVYTMSPGQLQRTGDPVAAYAPKVWRNTDSPYGPLTTVTEWGASKLAGDSLGRTVLWLKVWNALAFLAVALALDRYFRSDPTRRARAHLLWTVNPLMLLAVMAGGHNDVLGVIFGLLAVLALRRLDFKNGLAAGLLIGLAIAVKAPFGLFGLGLVIAAWRSPRTIAGLALGAVVVDAPGYAAAGWHSVTSVLADTSRSSLIQPWHLVGQVVPYLGRASITQALALLASVALAGLLLWGLPAGPPGLPGVRPVLAVTLAWLVWSPHQRAWYDVMIFPLLALMPATRLDWIVLARALTGAIGQLPGRIVSNKLLPPELVHLDQLLYVYLAPLALIVLAVALGWLCLTRQFGDRSDRTGVGDPVPL